MFIQKISSTIGKKVEAHRVKKAKIEELAQDMADWLPPYGYGMKGKVARRAVRIIKERDKEAQLVAKKNEKNVPKMLSGAFMDLLG